MGQVVQGLVGCRGGLEVLSQGRWEPWRTVGRGGAGPDSGAHWGSLALCGEQLGIHSEKQSPLIKVSLSWAPSCEHEASLFFKRNISACEEALKQVLDELPVKIEMVCICPVRYGSHQRHVVSVSSATVGLHFKFI